MHFYYSCTNQRLCLFRFFLKEEIRVVAKTSFSRYFTIMRCLSSFLMSKSWRFFSISLSMKIMENKKNGPTQFLPCAKSFLEIF